MLDLFEGISGSTKEDWLKQVTKDLKGEEFEKKLVTETDNQRILPLYTHNDLPEKIKEDEDDDDENFLFQDEESNSQTLAWNICEELTLAEDDYLNDLLIPTLKRGANFIKIKTEDWDKFSEEIRKIEYPASFALNIETDLCEDDIASHWRKRIGFMGERDRLIHSLEFNPIGYWMKHGKIENENKTYNNLADMVRRITAHLQDCKLLNVDVSMFEENPPAEQLTAALSITSEYFDKLSAKNISLEDLIHLISFRFISGNNFLLEIAKIRAFKILWKNLVKAFLPDYDFIPEPFIHVVTSSKQYVKEDAHSDLIRLTTQSMSAILGGANTVCISSIGGHYSQAQNLHTQIQNMLRFESFFDQYHAAADGSFAIESLTYELAEQAWKKFQNDGNWKMHV